MTTFLPVRSSAPGSSKIGKLTICPPQTVLRRPIKSGIALLVLLAIGAFCTVPILHAAQETELEYQVKAAYLYNFAKFVEWPDAKFQSPQTPLIIGVIGDDPFGVTLDQVVQGKTINGREVIIRRFTVGEDFKQCHLLFISRSMKNSVKGILDQLKGQNVLTVSEIDKFALRGGCINFFIANENVRFQINLSATERAGLRVSSKLLNVAKVVEDENKSTSD